MQNAGLWRELNVVIILLLQANRCQTKVSKWPPYLSLHKKNIHPFRGSGALHLELAYFVGGMDGWANVCFTDSNG